MKKNASPKRFYPAFLDLSGKKVVIAGGGEVAERKVMALLETGAIIYLVSPKATGALNDLYKKGIITWRKERFFPEHLEGAWLVIAATSDPNTQKMIFMEAKAKNIFCNSVDAPDLCTFIVPSTVRRGDLCLAISTSGKSPALCKHLRKEMERLFPPKYASYVSLLGELRKHIISNFPTEGRGEKCNTLVNPEALTWMEQGDWDSLEKWAREVCGINGEKIARTYRQRQDA